MKTSSSDAEESPKPFDVLEAMFWCNFPDKFRRADWKTPEFVKKYAPPQRRDGFRDFRGAFLIGPTGRKKTASLCLMARDWMTAVGRRAARAWAFVSFPELCVKLQESWRDGGHGPTEIINRLVEVPLLILDDVGAEKTTEFSLQSAYILLNKREQNEMPIFGTSNLTIDAISRKLDDRIASRIQGMCDVISVGGEDGRVKR